MYCKNCGAEITDTSLFCSTCGKPVSGEEPKSIVGFNRNSFKRRAKDALRKKYWYGFLVCLINTIVIGGLRIAIPGNKPSSVTPKMPFISPRGRLMSASSLAASTRQWNSLLLAVGLIAIVIIVIFMAVGIAYAFFLASPFAVGKKRFFVDNSKGDCEMGSIVYAFKGGRYLNIVKGMAWRALFQFLWSLLFIIPGIVKYYSYYLVPYILADNPQIGYDRALKLSMAMTRGYKFEIFVMQLSFIGWYMLGVLCLVIGTLFVNPYYEASFAEMYVALRNNGVATGLCTPQELNLEQE